MYPVNQELLDKYMAEFGLELAKGPNILNRLWDNDAQEGLNFQANDHSYLFTKNGKPFSRVSHPYGLDMNGIRQCGELAARYGIDVRMSARDGWYNPGRTIFVEFRVKDAEEDFEL